MYSARAPRTSRHFYPRPPRGGRHGVRRLDSKAHGISIHALREEGDRGVQIPSLAPNHENPNLFSIGEGFGFFVFFGNENSGSSLTAVCPKPYQKKDRITKVTTVKVP